MFPENPYNWTNNDPKVPLLRGPLLHETIRSLLAGNGCVLLGGMGMGKSVFLRQIAAHLSSGPASGPVKVLLLPGLPSRNPTVVSVLNALARQLSAPESADPDAGEILGHHLRAHPQTRAVVLLFDELDQYTLEEGGKPLGRLLFDHLEVVRRNVLSSRLGILAAGGLGIYALQDLPGSPFLSRADLLTLDPFHEEEVQKLAQPFVQHGGPLENETLQALHLASGGNPALATFGLQSLWERSSRTAADVAEIYAEFRERNVWFLEKFQSAIAQQEWSEAPLRVLERIQVGGGSITQAALQQACQAASGGKLRMNGERALRLLRSAGLVRIGGTLDDDPVQVRLIASILNLPPPRNGSSTGGVPGQLLADLRGVLAQVHAMAPDFFRPAGKSVGSKQLLPEATFSAFLALGLRSLGWAVEREAQHGAGYTDLKLSRPGMPGLAVVELKIWGRNDYREIHRQVARYFSAGVVAGFAIMFTDRADVSTWSEEYRQECLSGIEVTEHAPEFPLRGRFTARSEVIVEHLLFQLPRV